MGSGKSGSEIETYEYTMSMHVGICAAGQGIELLSVKYGEKEIWRGSLKRKSVVSIWKTDLFGGVKKEGGVKGMMTWLPGDRNQSLPHYIFSRLGLTRDTAPGFRGLASLFFSGTDDDEVIDETLPGEIEGYNEARTTLHEGGDVGKVKGFLWAINNPYLRKLSARVRRAPIGLNPSIALIPIPDSSTNRKQFGANPAHIIFECMTNRDWGMGERPEMFDIAIWEAAAQTLYDEGFALNLQWTRQSEIEKFIGEVQDVIQAVLFVDPTTGKHTIKLLRGDYDVNSLRQITPSNAVLSNFRRKTWGDITNEVTVTSTNAETGKEESVTAQDLAAIAMQGGVTSTTKNYYAVAYQKLAIELAERDLAAAVRPLATCDASVSRAFWSSFTGEVLDVSWPEYGVDRVIMRINNIEKDGNRIKLSLYEDIFGAERASYLEPGESNWVDPAQPPAPLQHIHIGTAPAFMTARVLNKSDAGELDIPEAVAALAIGPDSDDDVSFELTTWVRDVNGQSRRKSIGTRALSSTFILPGGLVAEGTSFNVSYAASLGLSPQAGDIIQVGTGDDSLSEIATVESINSTGKLVLNRGVLDTTPKDWPIGTRAWVVAETSDTRERATGEVVEYWPQTRTSAGVLDLADTPKVSVTLSDRAYKPNRPANVKVNGVGFGTLQVAATASVTVTWANRNRALEATQIQKWDDATVVPETGQTTTIELVMGSTVIKKYDELEGTNFVFPASDFGAGSNGRIRVTSVRNGRTSLQGHEIGITVS